MPALLTPPTEKHAAEVSEQLDQAAGKGNRRPDSPKLSA